MKTLTQALGLFVGLTLLLTGCAKDSPLSGTDSASIEVTGYLTASLIRTTSSEPLSVSTPVQVRIVGMPGAATNLAEVKATNIRSGDFQIAEVQEGGSFELTLMALKADSLAVTPVGVDSQESVSVEIEEIREFPEVEEEGIKIVYAMDFYDECEPFNDNEDAGEGMEGQDEWEHDWSNDEFDPETQEDCERAFVEIWLVDPLVDGRLIVVNLSLDLIEPLESENESESESESIWFGSIRASQEETLWLIHESEDGSWSTSQLVEVP